MSTRNSSRSYRPHLLALEPRMMFDAAAAVVAQQLVADQDAAGSHGDAPTLDTHDAASTAATHRNGALADDRAMAPRMSEEVDPRVNIYETRVIDDLSDGQIDPAFAATTPREIIFVDTSVDDYRQLADEWATRGEVVLIDGTRDGIDQVRAALAGRTDLAAIHLVSHGETGAFWLGTTRLDAATIGGELAGSLGAIGRSLASGGDILIYGCDFAEGADGARAMEAFAQATHADVAASTDATGSDARGGDWVLEANAGAIDASALSSVDWNHTLDPNTPVPISVAKDSLTVTRGATVVVTGATGYGADGRTPDLGAGAVAVWAGAATFQGKSVDLKATVVSISSGDAIRFNRPAGGNANNGDDATFLLSDLTSGATPATVEIRWELIDHATGNPLPADVRFTIADIDGIGGNPNTRETVTASTQNLAYYTRDANSDIHFNSTLNSIEASGTQDENNPVGNTLTPKSAASFDWSKVSSFTLTYTLTPNSLTSNAQFYHDGDADFVYANPVYVSIPRLDLDGDNSGAGGNDAHFTFAENGPGVPIVDADVVVSNPMDVNSIVGATVKLTNYKAGDGFTVGALPANLAYSIGAPSNGTLTLTFTGTGSESDYRQALLAVRYANSSDTPDPTQRVIDIAFSNDTLTSATATSRIDVVPVNDPPVAVDDGATTAEDTAVTIAVLGNDSDPEGDPLVVIAASALHGVVVRNGDGTLTYTPDRDYNGPDTISYTISDGQDGTASAKVAVTVTPVDDAPVAIGTLAARATQDAASVSYPTAGGFSDVDGDRLSYSATGLPAGLTIDAATGVISGTVDRSASQANGGSYSVVVTARDPSDASAVQRFTITVANPAPTATDDGVTTAEDTAVTIAVLGNDSDPDGDPLTVIAASALHGVVGRNADGTLTYTPDRDYNGPDTISYTISDGQGGTASARVAVRVTPVDDAPVAIGTLAASATQDAASVSYATAGGFSDVDGDRLTYSATGLPAGLTIDPATGVISGTVDRSASQANGGSYAVEVTARDPSNASAVQRFTITVSNPAPTATDDGVTTAEDTAVTIAVLGNDVDPDGDPLSVTAASALHGTVARNGDGTLTYTPDVDYNGSDTISYTISDGQGGTASAKVAVTVTPVDDAPVAIGALPDRSTLDGASVSYSTADAFGDVDGDALTFLAAGLPAGLTIDDRTGVISGVLDRSASQVGDGRYAITVTARDGGGQSATQRFVLAVGNPGPDAVDDVAATHVDRAVTIAVLGNDSDPDGDPLRVTGATAEHGGVVVLGDDTLRYTPPAGFVGRDTITYTISDGQGGTATARVVVDVANDAPTHAPLAPVAARDGETVSVAAGVAFIDPDGDPLTFSATDLPPGLAIDPTTGRIAGTLDRSASRVEGGRYTTVVTAGDGHGSTTSATLDWTIVNPAPTAADDRATTAEDTPVIIAPLPNDVDPDGDPLTIVSADAGHGSVVVRADGTLLYTPDRDFAGDDRIVYTVADGEGGRSTAVIVVTVTPVDDVPTTVGLPPRITADGATVSKPLADFFADPDGDPLRYVAIGLPAGLSIDPATGVVSGTIATGSANGGPDGNGVYHVVVTATDPSGGSVDARFDWTIAQDAPNAVDDRAATPEDTAVTIPVLANDSDPDGDALAIVGATASRGTVAISGGDLVFTPPAGFTGDAAIVYTVVDPLGHRATATVVVTVTPVDDAPVAAPLPAASGRDGQTITLPVGGFFSDPEGGPLRFAATGLPPGLSIDSATGDISGTIDRAASQASGGVYRIVVIATDPAGARAESAFAWTIVNPAPVAVADAATVREDAATIIAPLANDGDPDGDPLSIVAAEAQHGTVAINADGTLSYAPDADFTGDDVIVYTISDGNGGRASASVLVTVTPVDDAPAAVGVPRAQTVSEGSAVAIDAGGWFVDRDGDRLTFAAAGLPAGLTIDPATGRIAGAPDRSASQVAGGVYTVTVTATDPSGASATQTVTIRAVDPAPVAADDVARTDQRVGVTIPVLANDRDPDGDPLTVVAAVAAHGTATVNPDGTVRYVPDASFAGTDTLRYTISDGQGGTATATVTIVVDPVDRAPVVAGRDPVDAIGGRPTVIDALAGVTDPDGDPLTIVGATAANGVVVVNRDGTLTFTPALGFVGATTLTFTVADGKGGVAVATLVVRVADGRGADIEELLRIGHVSFRDPAPAVARIALTDEIVRNPLSLIGAVGDVRSLRSTAIGDKAVLDAVEAVRSLRTTTIDPDRPIAAEVARLDAIRDGRDAGDRLFDQRWSDFLVKGLTGFSAAADRQACIMVESVVRGGAIYLEVRDTAPDGSRAPVRSVDVRMADGRKPPDWIKVDHRGLAIIERAADADELRLIVRVTRADGRTSSTPIVVQGATGEVELDRDPGRHPAARPLHATLHTPAAAIADDAARLASHFE